MVPAHTASDARCGGKRGYVTRNKILVRIRAADAQRLSVAAEVYLAMAIVQRSWVAFTAITAIHTTHGALHWVLSLGSGSPEKHCTALYM